MSFLSSTINGYEGTGRSLSLKLFQQLRSQSAATAAGDGGGDKAIASTGGVRGRILHEITLFESIRYKSNDPVRYGGEYSRSSLRVKSLGGSLAKQAALLGRAKSHLQSWRRNAAA